MTTRRTVLITGCALAAAPALPALAQNDRSQILFVDGEPSVRRVVAKLLEARGYAVTTAGTGIEALQAIQAAPGRFGMMIADTVLPDFSGLEVMRIARDIGLEDAPVLLLTRYALNDYRFREADGEVQMVAKPISITELSRRVRQSFA